MNPIPLGIYRHYKGNQYEVIGLAKCSESLADLVIYKALYGEGGTWVRPLSMWSEFVEIEGKTVKRFEYVGESDRQNEPTEAHRALSSTLRKCETIERGKLGKSQQTLLERLISALRVAFLMGGVGAFLGMLAFRHKTKHTKFKVLLPLFAVLNIAAVAAGYYYLFLR